MGNFDGFGYSENIPIIEPDVADMKIIATVLIVYLVILLVALAYLVTYYVLQSLSTYTIAKRRGIHHPWLAWIPVANMWTLGSISDQYQYVAKGKVRNRRKILLGLSIAAVAVYVAFYAAEIALAFSAAFSDEVAMMDETAFVLVLLGFWLVVMVLLIVLAIFQWLAFFDLFESCKPDKAPLYLILSILLGVTLPFFVFSCRKKDLGMPPRKAQLPEQPAAPAEPEPQPEVMEAQPEMAEEPTEE